MRSAGAVPSGRRSAPSASTPTSPDACAATSNRAARLGVRLAAEAVAVGRAHGYELGSVLGIAADDWYAAGALDDPAAIERVRAGLTAWMATLLEPSHSSVGRDVQRGRRSEIDFTNGLVADKAREAGVPAPTHAAVTEIVRRIDRGELAPSPSNIDPLPDY
ncbi:MAG: hypothetical protein GEV05_15715 [Betaproteobacteria bacterium]|nr:hypothetical protein [Betaproteobacteria bacterium]